MADLHLALHSFIGANFRSSCLWCRTLPAKPSPEPPFKTFCISNPNSFGQDLAAYHHREWRSVDTNWTFTWNLNYALVILFNWDDAFHFGGNGLIWVSCKCISYFSMAVMKVMTKATYRKKFLQFLRVRSPSLSWQGGGRAGRNSAWSSELRAQLLNSKQKANTNWQKKIKCLNS